MGIPRYMFLAFAFITLYSTAPEAQNCGAPGNACRTQDGAYFTRTPEAEDRLKRHRTVVILQDAGQDPKKTIGDPDLIQNFLDRGYAVIVPIATKRKYVRGSYILNGPRAGTGAGKSKRRYVMQGKNGVLKVMRSGKDRGWYYKNTDRVKVTGDRGQSGTKRNTALGRDEYKFISSVILDASRRFFINQREITIIGVGHGGSLAWQLACENPDMADLFLPIDGAYWSQPPKRCRSGANLVHTHFRKSKFWPLYGSKQTRKRFGQSAIDDNFKVLTKANGCDPRERSVPIDEKGVTKSEWARCSFGASLGRYLLDEPFAFDSWWMDAMLGAPDPRAQTTETRTGTDSKRSLAKPSFLKPRFQSND